MFACSAKWSDSNRHRFPIGRVSLPMPENTAKSQKQCNPFIKMSRSDGARFAEGFFDTDRNT
jgi:hypothetical protein